MLIGYARVSTADQNLSLQLDALKAAGCEKIFTDQASGKKDNRVGLVEAMDYLREGDSLVVWKLDRLGRTMKGLVTLAAALEGVLGIFRPKTTKCSGGHAVRGLQRGITFLALHIASHNKSIT